MLFAVAREVAKEGGAGAFRASCVTVRAAGTRLLFRAQAGTVARSDIDDADLFALVSAPAWLNDQPLLAPRADHLFDVIAGAILPVKLRKSRSKPPWPRGRASCKP